MSRTSASIVAAALALAALTPSFASADESGAVHGVKTVGAMTYETLGRATSSADIVRQGGFAMPAAVDWTKAAAEQGKTAAVFGGGSTGALQVETLGLATSPAAVRLQGGAMTASAVRWASVPAGE